MGVGVGNDSTVRQGSYSSQREPALLKFSMLRRPEELPWECVACPVTGCLPCTPSPSSREPRAPVNHWAQQRYWPGNLVPPARSSDCAACFWGQADLNALSIMFGRQRASLVAPSVKYLPAMQETQVQSLGISRQEEGDFNTL